MLALNVLLPIVTNQEANERFIEVAAKGAKKVILLIIVDTSIQNSFGNTASSLARAQIVAEHIKQTLGKKRKSSELLIEWGPFIGTIDRIAKMKAVEKVVLIKQKGKAFKKLIKSLSERTAYKLELVEISE